MTDISKVIHLYLGCEVMAMNPQHEKEMKGYLTGIHGEYGPEVQFIVDNHAEESPEYPGTVKLVVRRLDGMTDEEKDKWRSISNDAQLPSLTQSANEFVWLLSEGFWLFGDEAFDSGLIIEAKV